MSRTEEIHELGRMLTATTDKDLRRINKIAQRLLDINIETFVEQVYKEE